MWAETKEGRKAALLLSAAFTLVSLCIPNRSSNGVFGSTSEGVHGPPEIIHEMGVCLERRSRAFIRFSKELKEPEPELK